MAELIAANHNSIIASRHYEHYLTLIVDSIKEAHPPGQNLNFNPTITFYDGCVWGDILGAMFEAYTKFVPKLRGYNLVMLTVQNPFL